MIHIGAGRARIGRVPPQPGLQLGDPPVGPLQPRGQLHHQPHQLLTGGLRLLGLGHDADDRRSKPQDQADTPTRSPEIKPGATAQLNRPREWTPPDQVAGTLLGPWLSPRSALLNSYPSRCPCVFHKKAMRLRWTVRVPQADHELIEFWLVRGVGRHDDLPLFRSSRSLSIISKVGATVLDRVGGTPSRRVLVGWERRCLWPQH